MKKILWLTVSLTALLWIWTILSFYIWSDIPLSHFFRRLFSFDKSTLSFAIWMLFWLGLKDVVDARRETAREEKEALQIETLVEASLSENSSLSEASIRHQLRSLEKSIDRHRGWFAEHLRKLLKVTHRQRAHVSQETFITLLDQKVHLSDQKAYYIVALGVLGTIVGILISLYGFDEHIKEIKASGLDQIKTLLSHSLTGLNTAFYTTLFGMVLGLFILHALISRINGQREALLIQIQEITESLVIPALNSWEGLSDDVVVKIAADYCETAKAMTHALNKLMEANQLMDAEFLQEVRSALTALEKPINRIQHDIQTIAGEMDGVSEVAQRLVEQIDDRNGMIAQIAETVGQIIEKLNNIFK